MTIHFCQGLLRRNKVIVHLCTPIPSYHGNTLTSTCPWVWQVFSAARGICCSAASAADGQQSNLAYEEINVTAEAGSQGSEPATAIFVHGLLVGRTHHLCCQGVHVLKRSTFCAVMLVCLHCFSAAKQQLPVLCLQGIGRNWRTVARKLAKDAAAETGRCGKGLLTWVPPHLDVLLMA